jgi:Ca2+-transporting ATPase
MPSPVRAWHAIASDEVARLERVDPRQGLSAVDAAARLQQYGPNALPDTAHRSLAAIVVNQFRDFMIVALLVAAVISGFVGDATDALAIVVIVVLDAVIGVSQEWRAEQAMSALRELAAPMARVRRDGAVTSLAADRLVRGDIVLLEAGNAVPADLRLREAFQLRIAEATLTGESVPSDKLTTVLPDPALALGDRSNMAYRGTIVVNGRAEGIAVATGRQTELGRIAELMAPPGDTRTPLQRRLAAFGSRLAWLVLALVVVIFAIGLLRGEPPLAMFLTAVSLAVAAIPEALPAVVGIALALGARRMARRNALVRRLPAVESLGSVTVICSDKTGTLTQNRMRVEMFWVDRRHHPVPSEGAPWTALLRALVLNNDVVIDAGGQPVGDPTEVAMLEAAQGAGLDKREAEAQWPRIGEIPFDSTRKRMTTIHAAGDTTVAYVKGAPEALLPLCSRNLSSDGLIPIDREECLRVAERMATEGLRVLAVACRHRPGPHPAGTDTEQDLDFIGLIGLLDPPRPEAAAAVAECRTAGIVPVMITGDHPATARAIAQRLGILGKEDSVITGSELAAYSDAAFDAAVLRVRVYARVSPEQKIRIVQALQRRGQVVAMTGDGVNDAPALRSADVGVAMGKDGTDVAREAAHLVLLDDNFATIVQAVREGRRILDNIRKFILYVMTGNTGELWTIVLAQLFAMPLPLLPTQILWINLVTDGLPGLALTREAAERDVMQRPPRSSRESIVMRESWLRIFWVGLSIGGASILAQHVGLHIDEAHGRTMAFTVLTLSHLGYILTVRTGSAALVGGGTPANPALFVVLLLTLGLQMAAIYLPPLSKILDTEPLQPEELALCLGLATAIIAVVEGVKAVRRAAGLRAARPA